MDNNIDKTILYIVATPIGNLEDMTYRAVRVLGEVNTILCEDTRVTKRLLEKYDITTPTLSYHAQSGVAKAEKILALLREGKDLALVSDAGTPTISDPGVLLIDQVRREFKDNVKIVPIPGPSALTAALSASGIPSPQFVFLGFLPHKKGRETLFSEIAALERTCVFYESPHRFMKTLDSLAAVLGESGRTVVVARELTKIHEELISGPIETVKEHFEEKPETVRGEFVIVIEGKG